MRPADAARHTAPRWVSALAVVAVLVLVVVLLGPALVGRETLLDVGILRRFAPWSAAGGVGADVNVCRSDTVDGVMPTMAEVRRTVFAGRYPTWNPFTGGGVTTASPNNGQLSPLSLPYYVVPLWLAPAWVKLLQVVTVLVGFVAWLRRLRAPWAVGLVAGLVYATSGYMLGWTNWPQTQVGAVLPLLFWATERLAQERRWRDAVPVALVVLVLLLGGFPAVTGMGLYVAGAYLVVRVACLRPGPRRPALEVLRAVVVGGLGVGLGLALAAFQLLPFLHQLAETDLSYRSSTVGSHERLATLVTLVAPGAQGLCLGEHVAGTEYAVEAVAFVGAATMVLVGLALLSQVRPSGASAASGATGAAGATGEEPDDRRRGLVPLVVALVVAIVVAGWLGGPLLAVLQRLPVFSTNPIARIRSVLDLLLALLAGLGLERLLRPGSREPGARVRWSPSDVVWRAVPAGFALVVAVLAVLDAVTQTRRLDLFGLLVPSVVGAAVVGVAALVACVLALRSHGLVHRLAVVAVVALVAGQGTSFASTWVSGAPREQFYPVTPAHAYLLAHLGPDRFAASDLVGYPPTASFYGLRTPVGHQFLTPRWRELLVAADPHVVLTPTLSDFRREDLPLATVGRQPLLDRLAVRYWMGRDDEVAGTVVPPRATDGVVTATAVAPQRCSLPTGAVRGLVLRVTSAVVVPAASTAPPPSVTVSVATSTGIVTGGRTLVPTPAGGQVVIPLPLDVGASSTSSRTAVVTVSGAGPVAFAASGGELACGVVTPVDDGLRLVESAPGATVWGRTSSLPRVRWAARSTVVVDPTARLAALAAGEPDDTVVLDAPGVAGEGRPADVALTRDVGGDVRATVTAQGAGYLVVADNVLTAGWSATVDGRPAPLVAADHAFGAVAVPAGSHTVELRYAAPGLRTGLVVAAVALVLVLVIAVGARLRDRRRRM